MKKIFCGIIVTLVVIFTSFSLTGCGEQTTIDGVFKYDYSSYTYSLYLYENGEGYMMTENNGKISSADRFTYKVIEVDKYIALTWYDDNKTEVIEYELVDNNHIVLAGMTYTRN